MRINPIKQKLHRGEPSVGIWQSFSYPGISSILSDAGFEWIVYDMEHGHYDIHTLIGCMDAAGRSPTRTFVRVPENNAALIKQILEAGAEGVVIPLVNTKEDAKRAVAACKYPPEGIRGIGCGRGARYGRDFAGTLANANENVLVCVQIEHIDAVNNIDEIAAVPGIDVLFIGPYDLSASLGITGQTASEQIMQCVDRVLDAGRKYHVPVGMFCRDEAHTVQMIQKGVQFISYTEDKNLFNASVDQTLSKLHTLMETL